MHDAAPFSFNVRGVDSDESDESDERDERDRRDGSDDLSL